MTSRGLSEVVRERLQALYARTHDLPLRNLLQRVVGESGAAADRRPLAARRI